MNTVYSQIGLFVWDGGSIVFLGSKTHSIIHEECWKHTFHLLCCHIFMPMGPEHSL
jgi:hypothetical protein